MSLTTRLAPTLGSLTLTALMLVALPSHAAKNESKQIKTEYGLAEQEKWFHETGELHIVQLTSVDKRWRLHEAYNPQGTLIERSEHLDKQRHGLFVQQAYDCLEHTSYRHGKRHGPYHCYDHAGEPMSSGHYTNDQRTGKWVSKNSWGQIISHYNQQGELHGQQTEFDANGQLLKQSNYKNGMLHGEFIRYENGQLTEKGHYQNDRREGEWIETYPLSTRYQGQYRNSYQVGIWHGYSQQGYLVAIIPFDNEGNYHGVQVRFHDSGALSEISQYRHGKRHGTQWDYLFGAPYRLEKYQDGQRVETRDQGEFKRSDFP